MALFTTLISKGFEVLVREVSQVHANFGVTFQKSTFVSPCGFQKENASLFPPLVLACFQFPRLPTPVRWYLRVHSLSSRFSPPEKPVKWRAIF